MHASLGDARKRGDLGPGGQPQLEARCAQPELEEGREVYWRTVTYTERRFGPSNSQRKIAW
jgi:hypothetical protein